MKKKKKKGRVTRLNKVFKQLGMEPHQDCDVPKVEREEFPFSGDCKKVIYPTEKLANQTGKRIKSHNGAKFLRAYPCEYCRGWHLSSHHGAFTRS